MPTETWYDWFCSWVWRPESVPKPVPAPFALSEDELLRKKRSLKPTTTRVAPDRFYSRVPHIREMQRRFGELG